MATFFAIEFTYARIPRRRRTNHEHMQKLVLFVACATVWSRSPRYTSVVTGGPRTTEELKQELDRLTSEQYEDFTDAIYFGMAPEKVRRMDARFARIQTISDELRYSSGADKGKRGRRESSKEKQ